MMGGGFNPDRVRTLVCENQDCKAPFKTTSRVAKYCSACSLKRAARYDAAKYQKNKAARRG